MKKRQLDPAAMSREAWAAEQEDRNDDVGEDPRADFVKRVIGRRVWPGILVAIAAIYWAVGLNIWLRE